jgi:RHS repeat-associated protein
MPFVMLHAQNNSNPVGAILGVIDVSPLGAATYTIPIEAAPGTQGVQPNLSIVYNSFSGMNILGMKWNLSGLSSITRCGQIPYYDDKIETIQFNYSDRFAIDGNRLLQIGNGNYGGNNIQYATEIEDFTRIVSYGGGTNGPPEYFMAFTDDGTIIEYGNAGNSIQKLGRDNHSILHWFINKITDFNGNYMTFHYGKSDNNEILIDSITYTGNTAAGITPYSKVVFEYVIALDILDNNTCFLGGYAIPPQTKLLKYITTSYKDTVVRKYEFNYVHESVQGERTAHLKEIVLYGVGGTEQLNATTIKWGDNFSILVNQPISGLPADFPAGKILTGDFNGDGYADFVVYDINWSGGKRWELFLYNPVNKTYVQDAFGIYTSLNNDNLFYAHDINGDGKDELILGVKNVSWNNTYEFFIYKIENGHTNLLYSKTIEDFYNIIFGDFEGMGKINILYVTAKIKTNQWTGWSVIKYYITGFGSIDYYAEYKGEPPQLTIDVIDYYGKGKKNIKVKLFHTDIYELKNGCFVTILSNCSSAPLGYDSNCAFYGDVNGDGLTDILVFCYDYNKFIWKLFVTKGDGTYIETNLGTELDTWSGPLNGYFPYYKPRFADLNGNGKEDIIQAVPVGSNTIFNILFSEGCVNEEFSYTKKTIKGIAGNYDSLKHWSFCDFNGDGKLDIIYKNNSSNISDKPKVIYLNQDNDYEFVQEIVDGIDKNIKLNYKHKYFIAKSKHTNNNPPYYSSSERKYFLSVIESVKMSNGIGKESNTLQYQFNTPVYSLPRKTFLGFNEFICINNLENKRNDYIFNFGNASPMILYDYDLQLLVPAIQVSYCGNKKTTQKESPASVKYLIDNRFVYKTGDIVTNLLANTFSITQNILSNEGRIIKSIVKTYDGVTNNSNNLVLTEEKNYYYKGICNKHKTVLDKILTTQQYTNNGSNVISDTLTFGYTGAGNLSWEKRSNIDGAIKTTYGNYTFAGSCREKVVTAGTESRIENYEYDNTERFVKQIQNLDYKNFNTNFTFDAKTGNKLSETDPNKLTTTYKYDNFGNLIQINYPDGTKIFTSLDWHGDANPKNAKYFTTTTSSGKADVMVYYDILGREICRNEDGYYYQTIHNNKGQIVKSSGPFSSFTSKDTIWHYYTYDIYGRKLTEKAPYTDLKYASPFGSREVTVTDNLRKVSSTKNYDALGRITTATDPGGTITYSYSIITEGNQPRHQTKITANNATTTIKSDMFGNRLSIIDPDAGEIKSSYNSFSELVAQINAKGDTTTYKYDKLGRVTQKRFADKNKNSQTITYTYDTGNKAIGQLSQIKIDDVEAESFTYDNKSRLSEHHKIIDGITYKHKYSYTDHGQLEELTYPDNFAVKYNYTPTGKLKEILRCDNNSNSLIYKVNSRNKYNAPIFCEYGNETATYHTYNSSGLLTRIKTGNKTEILIIDSLIFEENDIAPEANREVLILIDIDSTILNYRYTYNEKGLMSSRSETVLNRKEVFTYDNLDRLTQFAAGKIGEAGIPQTFQYANNGNINKNSSIGDYIYGINGNSTIKPHAVTKIANNTVSAYPSDVTYNFFNQPEKIEGGIYKLDIFYGANQQRQKAEKYKNNNLETTHYYVSKYYEREDTAHFTNFTKHYHYIYGDNGIVALHITYPRNKDSMYYVHTDHLGSFCVLTSPSKRVVQHNYFDPWGNYKPISLGGRGISPGDEAPHTQPIINFTLTHRGFTGHEHYLQFKIINMNGRLYDPVIARFFSPDKYVANSSFTQDFNRYTYARNNPLRYTDPSGEFVWIPLVVGAIIGAVQGVIQGAMIASQKGATGGEFAKYFFAGFGIGAGIGALTGWAGGALTPALGAAGIGGFAGGAISGAPLGLASGALTSVSMGALSGLKGNDLWNATWRGALIGMGTGVVLGGVSGGIQAKMNGGRFWDGATVREIGSSQPIPASQQVPGECQLESMRAISESYCDNFTDAQLRDCMVYDIEGSGRTYDRWTWDKYGELTGRQATLNEIRTKTDFANTFMDGNRISINVDQGPGNSGHSIVVSDMYAKEIIRVNGAVVYKFNSVNAMNPAINGYQTYKWVDIRFSRMFFIGY